MEEGGVHTYTVYGLQVHSELTLPELVPAPVSQPDVLIRYGDVPIALPDPLGRGMLYQAQPGQFLLRLDRIANYLVTDGTTITIQPAPNGDAADLRVFLLGSAFGALLHQRGVLPLHGSTIVTRWGALVFVGDSGNGKSTLAGALCQRGYRFLGDDVCVVRIDTGAPMAYPAFPILQLWADMQSQLDSGASPERVRTGLEKYCLCMNDRFADQAVPLVAAYELTTINTEELSLSRLDDADKFAVLISHTYRSRFLDGLGLRGAHFRYASEVARHLRVSRVRRPQQPLRLDALVDLIESDVQTLGGDDYGA
jgi:hypothetical protein